MKRFNVVLREMCPEISCRSGRPFAVLLGAIFAIVMIAGCRSHGYSIYQFDNGDDYVCDGLRRIVDDSGRIGFADERGKVVISPRYAFAFPFENGYSKATYKGRSVAEGEYHRWVSPEWFYIDREGKQVQIEDNSKIREDLEQSLKEYVADKDARIGVAVIYNGNETVAVNGGRDFPMMSVFKFPQALAVADYCVRNGMLVSDTVSVDKDEIKPDTWSPMREKYGVNDLRLPLSELLAFSLMQSDNNACDILFRLIGGVEKADSLMKSMGLNDVVISSTEDEMHSDLYLCYQNRSTPIDMAILFDRFYRLEMRYESPVHEAIGNMMILCETGENRLPAPLMPTNAVIGHKTGTGDRNYQDRIIGVNDAGYVFLPNGKGYSITVFIADSAYDLVETEKMIAEISDMVFKAFGNAI